MPNNFFSKNPTLYVGKAECVSSHNSKIKTKHIIAFPRCWLTVSLLTQNQLKMSETEDLFGIPGYKIPESLSSPPLDLTLVPPIYWAMTVLLAITMVLLYEKLTKNKDKNGNHRGLLMKAETSLKLEAQKVSSF